ncbi:MAG: cytochrome c [Gammaproteobacteria bacterium]|nr:cytochrome c [Gammaproteobacteria bacterium]
MRHIKNILLTFLVFFLTGISFAHAFSFDFGDDDDYHPYYNPYWGSAYNPWVAPPAYYYRRLPSYDRSTMVQNRQRIMSTHNETMNRLSELLYGRYEFNRAEAIKLARKIELISGTALTGNFHPDAVSVYRSRTTPALWGNEQTFRANAQALQAAAKDLAKELEKQPTAEEGAIYMPEKSKTFGRDEPDTVPVSAGIWEKFNTLSNVCESCHTGFRGSNW